MKEGSHDTAETTGTLETTSYPHEPETIFVPVVNGPDDIRNLEKLQQERAVISDAVVERIARCDASASDAQVLRILRQEGYCDLVLLDVRFARAYLLLCRDSP